MRSRRARRPRSKARSSTRRAVPVADARVTILELKRRTTTAADGTFRFDGIPPGTYLLEADSPRFGKAIQRVAAGAAPSRSR